VHEEVLRKALAAHGHLAVDAMTVSPTDDLYAVGLTSHATINVMLTIEDELGVEFPERLLRKSTFATIDAIESAISELFASAQPGSSS
jgi:acyl carrier protein